MQIVDVKAASFSHDESDLNDEEYQKTAKQCYVVTLAPAVNGVPVLLIDAATQLSTDDPNVVYPEEPEYNSAADQEKLYIYVDDTGIVRFQWTNPSEATSVMSANVTLKSFDEIMEQAKKNMFYKVYTDRGTTVNVQINSVRLSMMRIMRKDKPGEYMMVPVWDFLGNREAFYDGESQGWLPFGDQSYATINAIDGSSINREWGY